jgi:hypothetical protein
MNEIGRRLSAAVVVLATAGGPVAMAGCGSDDVNHAVDTAQNKVDKAAKDVNKQVPNDVKNKVNDAADTAGDAADTAHDKAESALKQATGSDDTKSNDNQRGKGGGG